MSDWHATIKKPLKKNIQWHGRILMTESVGKHNYKTVYTVYELRFVKRRSMCAKEKRLRGCVCKTVAISTFKVGSHQHL